MPPGRRSGEAHVDYDAISSVLAQSLAQELLYGPDAARLAYIGIDGDPRVVPVAFWAEGLQLRVATVPGTPKVAALRVNPRVAITIDHGAAQPRELLLRGVASIKTVEGVPAGYLAAARKMMTSDEYAAWEPGVLALYDEMAVIDITITWAKLIDFETSLPQAIEDLIGSKMANE